MDSAIDRATYVKAKAALNRTAEDIPYGESNVEAALDDVPNKIDAAINGDIIYEHPRGDAEMIGDSEYSVSAGCIAGFYEQIINGGTFEIFQARIYAADESAGLEYKIYVRDSATNFSLASTTPSAYGTISSSEVSHVLTQQTKLKLATPLTVPSSKYLYILFLPTTGSIKIAKWSTAATSGIARHGFIYSTTPGWSLSWFSVGSIPAFGQVGIKLSSPGLELPDMQDAIDTNAANIVELSNALISRTIPRIILPDEISAVVGDKIQIFTKGIIEAHDPYSIPYDYVCSVGNSYKRYYEITPFISNVGTKALTITLRDYTGVAIATKSCNIIINNPTGQPASAKNILCVGDSLSEDMIWPEEFYRRLCQAGGAPVGMEYGNINFIGNRAFTTYNTQKGIGYGGWRWQTYLGLSGTGVWINANPDKDATDQHSIWKDTNNTMWVLETIEETRLKYVAYGGAGTILPATGIMSWYSGGTHHNSITYTTTENEAATPFWDAANEEFSFAAFCSANGYSGIDAMYVLLGWNGLLTPNKYLSADHAANIAYAKTFADKFHEEYPSGLIRFFGLQVPDIDGLGTNYGANANYAYYMLLRSVMGWNLALQDMCKENTYKDYCRYLALAPQFDVEYNSVKTNRAVNARNSTTESVGSNGIHPASSGKYQIADIGYRDFIRTYCS